MEKQLESVMDELMNTPNVTGCLFADHGGLCLGAKGTASIESTGVIVALADQISNLAPGKPAPIIVLENDTNSCMIKKTHALTGVIFKTKNEAY